MRVEKNNKAFAYKIYSHFTQQCCKNQFQKNYTGSKNPIPNRLKIQFIELDFSKLIFQKSSPDQQGNKHITM